MEWTFVDLIEKTIYAWATLPVVLLSGAIWGTLSSIIPIPVNWLVSETLSVCMS